MKYLNFHTHQAISTIFEQSVYNVAIGRVAVPSQAWVSAGIHPWYIDLLHVESQLQEVAQLAKNDQTLAIGECGLDRLSGLSLTQQLPIFTAQVQLAEQLKKPVIVHCVRAFDVLMAWKKRTKPTVPLVVHGFNNNLPIARALLAQGFYFSLGAALLLPQSNASKVIKILPINRLFLENDDQSTPIETIYGAAAQYLELPIDALKNQIWCNFDLILGR